MHARWGMKEKFRYYTGHGIYQQGVHPYNSPYFGWVTEEQLFLFILEKQQTNLVRKLLPKKL